MKHWDRIVNDLSYQYLTRRKLNGYCFDRLSSYYFAIYESLLIITNFFSTAFSNHLIRSIFWEIIVLWRDLLFLRILWISSLSLMYYELSCHTKCLQCRFIQCKAWCRQILSVIRSSSDNIVSNNSSVVHCFAC